MRNAFSKYVDERLVEIMMDNPERLKMNNRNINFAMILVKEDLNIEKIISKIVSAIQKHDAMIDSITGTIITVYFGIPFDQPDQNQMMQILLRDLSENFKSSIAILHGACECHVGTLGNENRICFTALLPDYKSKLNKLISLEFGQIIKD